MQYFRNGLWSCRLDLVWSDAILTMTWDVNYMEYSISFWPLWRSWQYTWLLPTLVLMVLCEFMLRNI